MKSKFFNSCLVNGTLALICLFWTIPTFGLLITSFRDRLDIYSQVGGRCFPIGIGYRYKKLRLQQTWIAMRP